MSHKKRKEEQIFPTAQRKQLRISQESENKQVNYLGEQETRDHRQREEKNTRIDWDDSSLPPTQLIPESLVTAPIQVDVSVYSGQYPTRSQSLSGETEVVCIQSDDSESPRADSTRKKRSDTYENTILSNGEIALGLASRSEVPTQDIVLSLEENATQKTVDIQAITELSASQESNNDDQSDEVQVYQTPPGSVISHEELEVARQSSDFVADSPVEGNHTTLENLEVPSSMPDLDADVENLGHCGDGEKFTNDGKNTNNLGNEKAADLSQTVKISSRKEECTKRSRRKADEKNKSTREVSQPMDRSSHSTRQKQGTLKKTKAEIRRYETDFMLTSKSSPLVDLPDLSVCFCFDLLPLCYKY